MYIIGERSKTCQQSCKRPVSVHAYMFLSPLKWRAVLELSWMTQVGNKRKMLNLKLVSMTVPHNNSNFLTFILNAPADHHGAVRIHCKIFQRKNSSTLLQRCATGSFFCEQWTIKSPMRGSSLPQVNRLFLSLFLANKYRQQYYSRRYRHNGMVGCSVRM